MSEYYFAPQRIEHGLGSRAHWAVEPCGRAVVFVHGFGGTAEGTWIDFPSMLRSRTESRGVDLLFFGYEGKRHRTQHSAMRLRSLLIELVEDPLRLPARAQVHRSSSFEYEFVLLVGHSMGAIVIRQAIIDLFRLPKHWQEKIRIALFAPAHMGADIGPLVFEAVAGVPILAPVPALARMYWKALRDVEGGSQTIEQILDETRRALATGRATNMKARVVVHGGNDSVVNPNTFAEDPPSTFYVHSGHSRVCKPNSGWERPLLEVIDLIR